MMNNCLGTGMLGMALGISKMGVVLGSLVMVLSVLINRFTLLKIVRTCEQLNLPIS